AGDFRITIDRAGKREPRSIDLVLLGLGTCTISTVAQYLERKGLSTRDLAVELSAEFDEKHGLYKAFCLKLKVDEALPAEMHKTLAAVAKTCRIHKTLDSRPQIAVEVGVAMTSAG
ncbi:MAG: OsmC family protein, partial [Burkholderiales bacterium]